MGGFMKQEKVVFEWECLVIKKKKKKMSWFSNLGGRYAALNHMHEKSIMANSVS